MSNLSANARLTQWRRLVKRELERSGKAVDFAPALANLRDPRWASAEDFSSKAFERALAGLRTDPIAAGQAAGLDETEILRGIVERRLGLPAGTSPFAQTAPAALVVETPEERSARIGRVNEVAEIVADARRRCGGQAHELWRAASSMVKALAAEPARIESFIASPTPGAPSLAEQAFVALDALPSYASPSGRALSRFLHALVEAAAASGPAFVLKFWLGTGPSESERWHPHAWSSKQDAVFKPRPGSFAGLLREARLRSASEAGESAFLRRLCQVAFANEDASRALASHCLFIDASGRPSTNDSKALPAPGALSGAVMLELARSAWALPGLDFHKALSDAVAASKRFSGGLPALPERFLSGEIRSHSLPELIAQTLSAQAAEDRPGAWAAMGKMGSALAPCGLLPDGASELADSMRQFAHSWSAVNPALSEAAARYAMAVHSWTERQAIDGACAPAPAASPDRGARL